MNKECNDPAVGSMLHAYEICALTDEDAEKFEVHLLKCRSCFDKVLRFSASADLLRKDRSIRKEVERAMGGVTKHGTFGQKVRQHFWSVVAVTIIAMLLYPAWVGLKRFDGPKIRAIEVIPLVPTRTASSPINQPTVGNDFLLNISFDTDAAGKDFVVLILNAESDTLYMGDVRSETDSTATEAVLVPYETLSQGGYRIILMDTVGGRRIVQDGYSLDWRRK
jgi:hypothetical protein